MAKDRNTSAKPQKTESTPEKGGPREEQPRRLISPQLLPIALQSLSRDETAVLGIFRRYLMSAEQMLCLNANDVKAHALGLSSLVQSGLLVAESFQGGYALTNVGYRTMVTLFRRTDADGRSSAQAQQSAG